MREGDVRTRVLAALRARSRTARFVRELHVDLARAEVTAADVERALAELEADGAVVVREHACADPHLVGTDLRIVAAVEADAGGSAQLDAVGAIERAWREWLGEFLANHRCS